MLPYQKSIKELWGAAYYRFFFVSIALTVLWVFLSLTFFAPLSPFYLDRLGYGVDSNGTVYLGKNDGIHVYRDGKEIGCIRLLNYNSFTVTRKDELLIIDKTSAYYTDLEGNKTKDGPSWYNDKKAYQELADSFSLWEKVQTADGTVYAYRDGIRPAVIREDGAILYRAPMWEAVLRVGRYYILMPVWAVCLLTAVVWGFVVRGRLTPDQIREFYEKEGILFKRP